MLAIITLEWRFEFENILYVLHVSPLMNKIQKFAVINDSLWNNKLYCLFSHVLHSKAIQTTIYSAKKQQEVVSKMGEENIGSYYFADTVFITWLL